MANNKHLREIVERLLDSDTRCRNDTKFLTYRVFQEIAKSNGEKIFIPFTLFDKFPSFESVARCKRDILNKEGRYSEEFELEEGITIERPKLI